MGLGEKPSAGLPAVQVRTTPPTLRGGLILRNLFNFQRNELAYARQLQHEFGGLVRIRSLVSNDYVVTDPELFQHILIDHPERYDKQGFDYRTVGPAFGRGFGVAEGTEWNGLYNLAPLLRRAGVEATAPIILSSAEKVRAVWEAAARNNDAIDVNHAMRHMTFEIANRIMFGQAHPEAADRLLHAFDMLNERGQFGRHAISEAWHWLPSPANRRFDSATRTLDGFISERLAAARSMDEPAEGEGPLLCQLLRMKDQAGRPPADRELRDHIFNWLFDATEATASTLTWTWWQLAAHPEVQDRVRHEVAGVVGDRPVARSDVDKLVWTRASWQEAARRYPSNYFLSRRTLVDDELGGYHIPKGSSLVLSLYAAHHHPRWWPSPDSYDPDRFLPAGGVDRHRLAYMPFGAGRRRCIAAMFADMEAMLVLATLIPRVRLLSPSADVGADAWTILHARGDFRMRMSPAGEDPVTKS